jgi:hypothetical protein
MQDAANEFALFSAPLKKRPLIIAFVVVQILGMLCSWFSHHPYSTASALLWSTGFVALFPGNMLGSLLVEKLFWESHLPPSATDLLTVVLVVAINAILWFAVVRILTLIFGPQLVYRATTLKRVLITAALLVLIGIATGVYLGSRGIDIHIRW